MYLVLHLLCIFETLGLKSPYLPFVTGGGGLKLCQQIVILQKKAVRIIDFQAII